MSDSKYFEHLSNIRINVPVTRCRFIFADRKGHTANPVIESVPSGISVPANGQLPDCSGLYIQQALPFNNHPYYQNKIYYLWYNTSLFQWVISTALSDATDAFISDLGDESIALYTGVGSYTGSFQTYWSNVVITSPIGISYWTAKPVLHHGFAQYYRMGTHQPCYLELGTPCNAHSWLTTDSIGRGITFVGQFSSDFANAFNIVPGSNGTALATSLQGGNIGDYIKVLPTIIKY